MQIRVAVVCRPCRYRSVQFVANRGDRLGILPAHFTSHDDGRDQRDEPVFERGKILIWERNAAVSIKWRPLAAAAYNAMHPYAIARSRSFSVPHIRIVERIRRYAVSLMHRVGIELVDHEIYAQRRASIPGTLLAGALLTNRHISFVTQIDAGRRLFKSVNRGRAGISNEYIIDGFWQLNDVGRRRGFRRRRSEQQQNQYRDATHAPILQLPPEHHHAIVGDHFFATGFAAMRLAIAFLLMCFSASATAQSTADEAFENLAQQYLGELPGLSPVSATYIGDHSADDQLDQASSAARQQTRDTYLKYRESLTNIDRDALSRANQVDAELMHTDIESSLWSLDTLQEWAWNPMQYVGTSGSAIYNLVARDFAPITERLNNAAARLEQMPRYLEQARDSLDPERVPKIHAETAVRQNPGLNSIIDNMILPEMDVLSSTERARLEAAIETARDAIAEHQTWLEEELLPRAAGDFRIGAELYDVKLGFALSSPMGRKEVTARAESEYEAVRNEMYKVSREIYAGDHPYTTFPDQPDEAFKQVVIRAALEKAYQELPARDGIVDIARQQLQQATDFVIEKNIVTMPDDPIEIIVMPEFQRGVTLAYMDSPGPLDKGQKAFYAVAPLPADWTEEQTNSYLREYNLYSIQDLTIHEGVPGHHLQLALSNRYPSALRAVLGSGSFIEGWAVYAEGVMVDEGYLDHDPLMRLIQLKWYLRAVTNAIIDSAIHVDGMTREQAMKLMIEGGFQEEREAAGKWVRAQLTSAQLSTYFVGYQEHIETRLAVEEEWGDEFTLRRYHDQALSYGSPPGKFVRALILNEPIPRSN